MSYQPLWLRDLVAYSIQAAALVGVGTIMASLLRLRVPRVRLGYWQALLAVCVLLPLLQPWRPEILETPSFTMSNITLAATEATSVPTGPSLAEIVLWLICAGVVLRLAWMALGLGRLWLYRRHAERINQTPEAVREAQRLVPASSVFFISHQIPTPATFGFFKPAILFPARFLEMGPAMQKAIALHELLHVERRDWLWNMFEEVVLTLLWFHLPLWWVVRSARLSREQVVDAEAVRRSKARRPYLKALLEMAGQKRLAESLPAPLFLRENQLAERVALMMKEVHMSRTRSTISILTAAVALLIAGAALVWAFPLKTSAQQMEVPAVSSAPAQTAGWVAATGPSASNSATAENGPAQTSNGAFESKGKEYKFDVEVYKVGGKVSTPVPIYRPDPPYMPQAKTNHVNGTLTFHIVVDTKGKVAEVKEISKPLGMGLDENAIKTIQSWRFKPAMREGKPVPVEVSVGITFKYYDDTNSDPVSQNSSYTVAPPAQGHANASIPTGVYATNLSQEEYQQQLDEAMKQAQVAQAAASQLDQKKLQEQVDQAMKQLKAAQMAAPKIDETKLRQQIEQAMKQAKIAQGAASKIDQKKMQQQMEEAMKQLQKMNTPEMRQRLQEQMEQLKKLNSPEMRRRMQAQMDQLKKLDTPEMQRKMQEQMEQLRKMNTPEMRQRMEEAMKQLKMAQMAAPKIDEAQIQQQVDQAMEQAKLAQKSAAKVNRAELQRQLDQARKQIEQARKEVQAARKETKKARLEALKARRKAEEQRKEAKPAPSATPKQAPAPPKEITAPPAPPKTPGSAAIVGGVPGGVGVVGGVPGGIAGGVIAAPLPPMPPTATPKVAVPPAPPVPPASLAPPPPQS